MTEEKQDKMLVRISINGLMWQVICPVPRIKGRSFPATYNLIASFDNYLFFKLLKSEDLEYVYEQLFGEYVYDRINEIALIY